MFALYSHIVAIVFTEVIRRFIFSYSQFGQKRRRGKRLYT